jgi:hypothetical protein
MISYMLRSFEQLRQPPNGSTLIAGSDGHATYVEWSSRREFFSDC